MAKIDTALIEGYEAMSADEKVKALEAIEYDDGSAKLDEYKNALSKANSENAEWKKKYNSMLSDEEKKKEADAEKWNAVMDELEKLRTEKVISTYKASFSSMGYDDSLADETAKALAQGNIELVLENQKKHLGALKKQIIAENAKNFPVPPAGDDGKSMTFEDFRKLSAEERYRFSQEHPDEYKEIYGGKS